MADRVKPVKIENSSEGTEDDKLYTEIDPREDTIPMFKELLLVDDESDIKKTTTIQQGVKITEAHEIALFDRISGEKTLATILAGFSAIVDDPTGFKNPEDVAVSYDSSTRKITLGGTVVAYYRGKLSTVIVSSYESPAHEDTTGSIYYLYYNGTDVLWSKDTHPGFNVLLIAIVKYGTSHKYGMRECHGFMPWMTHKHLHNSIGLFRLSGGDISGVVLDSTTAAERRPNISASTLLDEDLLTVNPQTVSGTSTYAQFYLTSTGVGNYVVDTSDIVALSNNQPSYNLFTGGNWTQQPLANNAYMCVWLIAIPVSSDANSQKYRHIFIQGQSAGNLVSQQALVPQDVNVSGLLIDTAEFVFLSKFILKYTAGNWSITEIQELLGTSRIQIGTPSGHYLSSVTTDETLSGDGTPESPLTVVGGAGVSGDTLLMPFSYDGMLADVYLDYQGLSSFTIGAPMPANMNIDTMGFAFDQTATITVQFYSHDGGGANATSLGSKTITAKKAGSEAINFDIAKDKMLAIKVTSVSPVGLAGVFNLLLKNSDS